ncbi:MULTISPECIES: DNA-binding protein [Pseudomonas]|uniref:DNA-binding protein n=1 Tax=Pseudomonas TaxID=286 RepID=UPI000F52B083|nr:MULTISPECIES: DNA-binding protein [Pseudomonas]MCO7631999.1 DNA-binding protein [Pseudomonas guariconensis]RQJ33253.1 plasmid-related protein [Pseudomonas aeruginosa]
MTLDSLEQHLLETFGPLLTLEQLAQLLHRSPGGLRFSLTTQSAFARQINATKVRLGRRAYFRTSCIASVLSGESSQ